MSSVWVLFKSTSPAIQCSLIAFCCSAATTNRVLCLIVRNASYLYIISHSLLVCLLFVPCRPSIINHGHPSQARDRRHVSSVKVLPGTNALACCT